MHTIKGLKSTYDQGIHASSSQYTCEPYLFSQRLCADFQRFHVSQYCMTLGQHAFGYMISAFYIDQFRVRFQREFRVKYYVVLPGG